jgi:GH25 family lysozyme M1 (1,4-beta-N-acetylmuramidase)
MAHPINPMVVDLSHYDPAHDYPAVKASGKVGVIYKATEGTNWTDDTYVSQQRAAKDAGLKWGAYHFGDSSDVDKQVANFMRFAGLDPDELFALDWEDNGANTMSVARAKEWISKVEQQLGRPGQCVIYSGNTAKDLLGNTKDEFLGARRLWLAQYGSTPTVQASWHSFWLWQYTDGSAGPGPHTCPGCDSTGVDMNSYDGTADRLAAEWATGSAQPAPVPSDVVVDIVITAPPGVTINVTKTVARSRSNSGSA